MKAIAGGLIALVLLFFYIVLVFRACDVAACMGTKGCDVQAIGTFNDQMAQAMAILSGLVSALIISELAAAKPGEAPGERILTSSSPRAKNILRWVTGLYVLAWILIGAWAFWRGLNYPSQLPALTTVGQAWIGLAVVSAYAYFGIKPD